MKEIDNIIRILKETKRAINNGNSFKIKKLSDQTIHTAAISQDPDNVVVAVLVYSISKVIEREHYHDMPGWKKFYSLLLKNLDLAIISLEKNDLEKFRLAFGKIRHYLDEMNQDLAVYIEQVFQKAGINKAFKIYEHGLSSQQTAKLLGISLWDLATYIGQSRIHEAKLNQSIPEKQRIKIAEEVFS